MQVATQVLYLPLPSYDVKIPGYVLSICDKAHVWPDWLTDGHNYDTQDRASIATSRGKNSTGLKESMTA